MKTDHIPETLSCSLRAASLGLVLAVLTLLFGQGMGLVFGANEDAIKSRLKAAAAEARDSVYKGDDAAIKDVQLAHLRVDVGASRASSPVKRACPPTTSISEEVRRNIDALFKTKP